MGSMYVFGVLENGVVLDDLVEMEVYRGTIFGFLRFLQLILFQVLMKLVFIKGMILIGSS